MVSQQLVTDKNGQMIPVYEILHMNNAACSMIRDNKNYQLPNVIAAGGKEGMVTMDQSLLSLYHDGKITKETALRYADNQQQMQRNL